MSNTLRATTDMMRAVKRASGMKVSRNFEGFFADRIIQAASQPALAEFVERLAQSVDVSVEYVGGKKTAAFVAADGADDAPRVLAWIRRHPRLAAMICMLRDEEDYANALASVRLPEGPTGTGRVSAAPQYDVPLSVHCMTPLAHGSDQHAGNATLFRRCQVLADTGETMSLPHYAGNALRGQLRDLLADHYLSALGLSPSRASPPVQLWFFHALYAGGVLEEGGAGEAKKIAGAHGAMNIGGIAELREMVPPLSLLGVALGNRVLSGRCAVGDLRPACREWGTGETPVAELMDWEYLTRRDDHEGRDEEDPHHGMIATTEVLRAGTALHGGIDLHPHASELERSVVATGLALLADHGKLGGQSRRGFGQVAIERDDDLPRTDGYEKSLRDQREEVLAYLERINALR